jgi:hypothetical protein
MKSFYKFVFLFFISLCSYGQTLVFPDAVEQFTAMTDIQQEEYRKNVVNKLISGKGKIQNVEECGITSKSKSFDRKCYEVILIKGSSKVVLYFSLSEKSRVIQLKKNEQLDFTNCKISSMIDFGFWSTVFCDINFVK